MIKTLKKGMNWIKNTSKSIAKGSTELHKDGPAIKTALNKHNHKTNHVPEQVFKGIKPKRAAMQGLSNAVVGTYNVTKPFFKRNNHSSLIGVSLNNPGIIAAVGLGAANTVKHEVKDYVNNTMIGQRDYNTTPFAPRLPSYAFGQQSGATGNLALSMGKMKR